MSCWCVNVIFLYSHQNKDVTEASGHIEKLTGRLRDLETSLTESRSRENKLLRDLEENKRRYREAKHEITHLKGTNLEDKIDSRRPAQFLCLSVNTG